MKRLILTLCLILCFEQHGYCVEEEVRLEKLKRGGKDTFITLTDADIGLSSLVFYAEVTESVSSLGEVYLNASVPLKGFIEYKKIKRRAVKEVSSLKGWIRLDLDIGGAPSRSINVKGAAPEEDGFLKLPPQSGTYGRTFFSFDTCDPNARYLVRLVIDLSNLPDDDFGSGILIHTAFRISAYLGFKGASLKPMGEGRYKSPLLLISSIGAGEIIRLLRWQGSKIVENEIIPFPDYVGHRGQILIRAPLGKEILKGGKGVFELILPGIWAGYSTCFYLHPTRQYSGGYKR